MIMIDYTYIDKSDNRRVTIDYNEYEELKNSLNEKNKMILKLYDALKLSNNTVVIASYYGFPESTKVLKDGKDCTEYFIRRYAYESPYKYGSEINTDNSKKILSIIKEYIEMKLHSNWLTRKLKSKILKVLGL